MPTRKTFPIRFTRRFYARRPREKKPPRRRSPIGLDHSVEPGTANRADRQRTATALLTWVGVMKISSSLFCVLFDVFRNRYPSTGTSPSNGTFVTELVSVNWKMPPQDHGPAVVDEHLRVDVLRIDRESGRGGLTDAVLGHVDVEDDVALRRDLRRDLELQVGLAELDAGRTARRGHLVRQFGALLDQRLDRVGRDDPRARHDLALPVGFERRQLEVQELGGRLVEETDTDRHRIETVDPRRRQAEELRVGDETGAGRRRLPGLLADARDSCR